MDSIYVETIDGEVVDHDGFLYDYVNRPKSETSHLWEIIDRDEELGAVFVDEDGHNWVMLEDGSWDQLSDEEDSCE